MIVFKRKTKTIALLAFLALLIFACGVVYAENDANDLSSRNEVLTPLKQRMLKKVSVEFRDTPIEDVLRIMADQADIDIVTSPSVTGNVTATLKNVPLEEALANILAAHGYGYILSKNMIRVAPIEEITEKTEMLVNSIYRITYADVEEVEKTLKKFISSRGSLSSNKGTSNIIVTDTESRIKAIDTFIKEIDRITPQILIEARIYDIKNQEALDLGIEWAAGRNTTLVSGIGSNPTAGRTDPFITGGFSGATSKTDTAAGSLRWGWLNSAIDIDMIMKAQKENINAKLLANPRVLVLDNESAQIRIISEIPYQELTESSDGGSVGTTAFREVGVELQVIPHVTRDGMVRVQLKPKFSVVTGEVTIGTAENQFEQPVVDTREADTTLLIKDGQTVVLGGLRKKDVSQQINKIPLLGDLPLLGMLFRFEGEDTTISELVVFVTPHIIENPEMTPIENAQFQATEFAGPEPAYTKAETAEDK